MPDRNIEWSDRALEDNIKLVDYLLSEWGAEIAQRVSVEIDETIIRIRNHPEHFPIVIKRKNIRRCVASPQTSIYFKVNKDQIHIITLLITGKIHENANYKYYVKLRVARHTSNLKPLISFYTTVLGLDVIGSFTDHAGYDGVFIGGKNSEWHLEFTTSANNADHHADEDDLLVFYVDEKEYDIIIAKALANNITPVTPKNPYWKKNGFTISDPDGFRIVVTIDPIL